MNNNGQKPFPKSYLFTWNPTKWPWTTLDNDIYQLKRTGTVKIDWNCSNQNAKIGDRFYLIQLGVNPRGIFASGKIVSSPEPLPHFDGTGNMIPSVYLEFEVLLKPSMQPILNLDDIKNANVGKQHWSTQS